MNTEKLVLTVVHIDRVNQIQVWKDTVGATIYRLYETNDDIVTITIFPFFVKE